jgi:hypothetical protein
MNEDTILTIKWLESPEGEEWSRAHHWPISKPLLTSVRDGDPSCIMGGWTPMWIAG